MFRTYFTISILLITLSGITYSALTICVIAKAFESNIRKSVDLGSQRTHVPAYHGIMR